MPIFKFVHTNVIEEYTTIYVEAASAEEAEAYTEAVNDEAIVIDPTHDETVDERIQFEGEVDPEAEKQESPSSYWGPDIVIDDEFRQDTSTDEEIRQKGYVPMTHRGGVSEDGLVRFHRAAVRRIKDIK